MRERRGGRGLTSGAELSVHPSRARCRSQCPWRAVAGREGGGLMAGSAVRESVTLAGLAERARVARAFTGGVLGPGHPCQEVAVLLVSELFGNSIRHSGSGLAGGRSRSQ
jgi:hypothetical protein